MKKILVTGATDGIGFETVKSLATLGHDLIIHGRTPEKLKMTIDTVKAINPDINIVDYLADLSDIAQVKTLIAQVKSHHKNIDVIINNAGVFKTATPVLGNGFDVRFIVNTISPYLITKQLLPLLTDNGRIVNLSSAAQAPINLNALAGKVSISDDFSAYAQSKLAITIWSQQLAHELKKNQVIIAVNPGSLLASKMVKEGFGLTGNDLGIGADILIKAALSAEFSNRSGQYYDNDAKQFAPPHSEAADKAKCVELMKTIEQVLVKLNE